MSDDVQAFIGGIEPPPVEPCYDPGPEPRPSHVAEHRTSAFYRLAYLGSDGRPQTIWRVADCDKHAVDTCLTLGPVIRLARYATKAELIDALPPGRAPRSVLPPTDLKLAHSLGLLTKRDTTP